MAYLDNLYSEVQQKQGEIARCTAAINECEGKKQQAIRRRLQVNTINKRLKNDFDDNIEKVNNNLRKVITNLEDAIKGENIASHLIANVDDFKELTDVSDTDLVNAKSEMDAECMALTSFITQMDEQIKGYTNSINQCQTSIQSLNSRILSEQNRIKREAEEAQKKAQEERRKASKKQPITITTTIKKGVNIHVKNKK